MWAWLRLRGQQINPKRSRRSQRGNPSVNSGTVSTSVKTLKESTAVIPSGASLTAVSLCTYTAPADMSFESEGEKNRSPGPSREQYEKRIK